jgi:Ca2+-binding RTX toxin-like protein
VLLGGAGDDEIDTRLAFVDGGSRVEGGDGDDTAYVWSVAVRDRRVLAVEGRLDLGTGAVRMRRGDQVRRAHVAGVETLRIPDGRWTVLGTAADETFWGGDAGRDAIVVRAGGGDDRVSGTPGADRLHGGPGRDTVGYVAADDLVRGFEVVRP